MKFGLSQEQYQLLEDLVIGPLKKKGAKVWIFGSRARGDHHKYSDIDLLYEPQQEGLEPELISSLNENAENSDLSYKVDLVSTEDLAKSYWPGVQQERVEV